MSVKFICPSCGAIIKVEDEEDEVECKCGLTVNKDNAKEVIENEEVSENDQTESESSEESEGESSSESAE
jgi:DNA-directed RNA polymerase subunit M/transcription elongation factor TFIIS